MELGFGNVSMVCSLFSIHRTDWLTPAAIVGAAFYGLAGLQHVRNTERTRLENIAMASDLFIAAIAIFYLIAG